VLVEIVVVVVLALAVAAGLGLWIARAASCGRTIDLPGAHAAEPDKVFWGGVMCRYLITSGTLVRLEFFDWGVRIRGIAISRWIVPTWEARYEDLAMAELVSLHSSRIAVWFRLRGGAGGMAFLSYNSNEILPLLERHDVPVNRSLAQIRRVAELYRAGGA
jgi:hypothetical protein